MLLDPLQTHLHVAKTEIASGVVRRFVTVKEAESAKTVVERDEHDRSIRAGGLAHQDGWVVERRCARSERSAVHGISKEPTWARMHLHPYHDGKICIGGVRAGRSVHVEVKTILADAICTIDRTLRLRARRRLDGSVEFRRVPDGGLRRDKAEIVDS